MKSTKTIWGIVLIGLGVLLVLNNLNFVDFGINWHRIGDFWPLILIALGLTSISKSAKLNPWITNSLLAVVISVFIYNVIEIGDFNKEYGRQWNTGSEWEKKSKGNKFYLPLDSGITEATLDFSGGAAEFDLNDTTSALIEAETRLTFGHYVMEKVNTDNKAKIKFEMEDEKNDRKLKFKNNDWEGKVKMKLNPEPLWNFNFQLGAGDVDFDLSKFKVNKLDMDAGAASVKLRLSDLVDTSNVTIDAGASHIEIYVPKGVRCKVTTNTVLSSRDFDGFIERADGQFESENYSDKTLKLINISVDAGVSNLEIKRY